MAKIDVNQVARFEAAYELMGDLIAIFRVTKEGNTDGITEQELENREIEVMRERQKLHSDNDEMVKVVRDTYGPLVRDYWKKVINKTKFVMSREFLETKVDFDLF